MEDRFRIKTQAMLEGAEAALAARNAIVHRVWSKAGLDDWSGWKPLRAKQRTDHWLQDYKEFTPDDFTDLISSLCEIVGGLGAAIAEAGSYPRKA